MTRRKASTPPVPTRADSPAVAPTAASAAAAGSVRADAKGVSPDVRQPRRRLVVRLATLFGVAALAESAWVAASFLRPRQRDAASANLFVAGPLDRFEPGSVTAFPSGRFYLVRLQDGGLLALHRECTHLGCTVPWDAAQGRFACPCHASAFDITGAVLNAPAPRPLDFYAVRVENGIVKVDTRRRQSRTAFDPSQVTVA
jgi:cytochrome b6-f complex iron-sulfur subunit